jgi:F0F1-type ATP synthase membrane subunit a
MGSTNKVTKLILALIWVLVFLFLFFIVQVAKAQDIVGGVQAPTERVFATNADNVYGTLVGVLFFALVGVIGLFFYIVKNFIPLLDGLKHAIVGNSTTIERVNEELKDLGNLIRQENQVLELKLGAKLDSIKNDIISNIINNGRG